MTKTEIEKRILELEQIGSPGVLSGIEQEWTRLRHELDRIQPSPKDNSSVPNDQDDPPLCLKGKCSTA